MKGTKERPICLILILALLITTVPAPVQAVSEDADEILIEETTGIEATMPESGLPDELSAEETESYVADMDTPQNKISVDDIVEEIIIPDSSGIPDDNATIPEKTEYAESFDTEEMDLYMNETETKTMSETAGELEPAVESVIESGAEQETELKVELEEEVVSTEPETNVLLDAIISEISDTAEMEGVTFMASPDGVNETASDGFQYNDLGDGTVEINGYTGNNSGDLIIPGMINDKKVTHIGEGAFSDCSGFTGNLVLPDSLEYIGEYAFSGCSGFTGDLELPDGLTSIGEGAFSDCSGFTGNLKLPDGLTSIPWAAFSGCSGLTGNLILPDGLTGIGGHAFQNCSGFTGDLKLPESLASIGEYAFYNCSGLTGDLVIPGSVENMGDCAFAGSYQSGGSLVLQDNASAINWRAFCWSGNEGFSLAPIQIDQRRKCSFLVNICGLANVGEYLLQEMSYSIENPKIVEINKILVSNDTQNSVVLEVVPLMEGTTTCNVTLFGEQTAIDIRVQAAEAQMPSGYEDMDWTWHIPETIKLGWKSGEHHILAEVRNIPQSYLGRWITIRSDGFGYFCSKHSGYSLGDLNNIRVSSRNETLTYNWGEDYAIHPGTITLQPTVYDEENGVAIKLGEPYTVTIEEPVISTNAPQSVTVGDVITLSAELQNTELSNQLVPEPEPDASYYDAVTGEMCYLSCSVYHNLVYQPEFVIERGAELVDVSEGDFSHTLTASEKIKFKGTGTVQIRIKYRQSAKCQWVIDTNFDGYNYYEPEKLITIQVNSLLQPEPAKVSSIELSRSALRLVKGETAMISALVNPESAANKAVTWTTSNKKVATIDVNGKIRAKGVGKAVITATAADGSGKTAQCKVTVGYKISYKMNGGKNNSNNPSAYYKESIKFKEPTRKGYVFKGWYTDKGFRHKITKITPKNKKNLTLYAKWQKEPVLSKKEASVTAGKTIRLSIKNTGSLKVTWSSSNKKIAVVKSSGTKVTVTGKKAGSCRIVAKVDGRKYVCRLAVKPKPEPKLSKKSVDVKEGNKVQISIKNIGKAKVKWSTSNKKIIRLKVNGAKVTITGKKAGACKLTATVGKRSYTCSVRVTQG